MREVQGGSDALCNLFGAYVQSMEVWQTAENENEAVFFEEAEKFRKSFLKALSSESDCEAVFDKLEDKYGKKWVSLVLRRET